MKIIGKTVRFLMQDSISDVDIHVCAIIICLVYKYFKVYMRGKYTMVVNMGVAEG